MLDVHVEQIETAERTTELGAKGVGGLGLTGAMGHFGSPPTTLSEGLVRQSRISLSRPNAFLMPSHLGKLG